MNNMINNPVKPACIPILTYHRITEQKEKNLYHISSEDFKKQMKFLHDNDYRTLSIDDFYNLLINKKEISHRSILISFDDGASSDFFIALPILKEYNLSATFFITTDWIDKNGYMKKNEIVSLFKEGMSIHSHAKSHKFLDNKNINIIDELKVSKETLEQIMGNKVRFLSFPGGRYNDSVLIQGQKIGYHGFCSSKPFFINMEKEPLIIGRCMIKYNKNGTNFDKLIKGGYLNISFFRFSYFIKTGLKSVLGNNLYHLVWKKHSNVY